MSYLPLVEQLAGPVLDIFNHASALMVPLLEVLKVEEKKRSPFATTFVNMNAFRKVFDQYVTPKSRQEKETPDKTVDAQKSSSNAADSIADDSNQNESNSQQFGVKVHKDHVSLVVEALQQDSGDTVAEESTHENAPVMECDVDGTGAYAALVRILRVFKDRAESSTAGFDSETAISVVENVILGMQCLSMKNRERGSITSTLKYNTLRGRWYAADKAVNADNTIALGTLPSEPMAKRMFERDLVLKLPSIDPKSRKDYCYRVLGVYSKYSNKWFVNQEGRVKVTKKDDEGKYVLLVSMVTRDPVTKRYVAVLPSKSTYSASEVYRRGDAYRCRNMVIEKLDCRPSAS